MYLLGQCLVQVDNDRLTCSVCGGELIFETRASGGHLYVIIPPSIWLCFYQPSLFSAHTNHLSQISAAIWQPFHPFSRYNEKFWFDLKKKRDYSSCILVLWDVFLREKQLLFQIDVSSYSSHFRMRHWFFFYCRRYFKMNMQGGECINKISVNECHQVTI